jgi:oxygen-independent coproporphyrinogen III oxidase
MNGKLIQKYNVLGPRYTSYPTVPYWDECPPSPIQWSAKLKKTFEDTQSEGISLYIHLPYCESLCTYCGCNTRITVNHAVEIPYINSLLQEWDLYLEIFGSTPTIKEIHLGGGTPTFFKAENLRWLIEGLLRKAQLHPSAELSFEAHPNNTSRAHLLTLYQLGFRRLSLGIQDFDLKVQTIVNRIQSAEQVQLVTDEARQIGYTSINYDLIYGLPLQTLDSVKSTIDRVIQLKPDRIAFYSYAHVPWIKPGQRKFTEADLPADMTKRALYEAGKAMFLQNDYEEIGMDHFALQDDCLAKSFRDKNLHRNFMGYSTQKTTLLIGLGASAIGDSWTAFAQNLKKIEDYQQTVNSGILPIYRGHILTEEDLILRKHILNLMCRFETSWWKPSEQTEFLYEALPHLEEMQYDGLIEIMPYQIKITDAGRPFVRNICMALDARLFRRQPQTCLFSSVI